MKTEEFLKQFRINLFPNINQEFIQQTKEWLDDVKEHLGDGKLSETIKKFMDKKREDKDFFRDLEGEGLLTKIDENFQDDGELHRLQNLALLDENSNKQIGNLMFRRKQTKIREILEKEPRRFFLICTLEVFEKKFSKNNENKNKSIFMKQDQKDYLEAIKSYLKHYIERDKK
ncbi:hypothetical protein NHP21005_09600 [Helicobacter sp. NHP21005]|uniref:hypothetical protein n=1 Tax=Helicobacter felistomachi TaxID=3040201 RepID=UPI002572DE8B|nr:hypothetical protein [Helicobacter sp. NHP21005]BEG57272.1 hypothetical protein NHP21005_09600 [Helicobacter sp. NHP21005]